MVKLSFIYYAGRFLAVEPVLFWQIPIGQAGTSDFTMGTKYVLGSTYMLPFHDLNFDPLTNEAASIQVLLTLWWAFCSGLDMCYLFRLETLKVTQVILGCVEHTVLPRFQNYLISPLKASNCASIQLKGF